jgi:Nucleotidyl transferase AbiEii toxin, Type IV TA system
VTDERSYSSPAAFRQALTDKLRALAKESKWSLEQLQRQIAYDRLLERLYLTADDWIVKGATALLARDLGVRGSIDIDVYRNLSREAAEADLRAAARKDIGDWFRFELAGTRPSSDGSLGVRIPVTAYIGATPWASFHVDLSGDELRMTGQPEDVPPLARVTLPDFSQHGYRAYPLVDHVADKIVATVQRYGSTRMPSTRYKDLVDLVAIVTGASVAADAQIKALISEAGRREVRLPASFDVPDRSLWEAGYAAEARRSLLDTAGTLDEALAVVRPFVDPLLDRSARGIWDPTTGRWTPSSEVD